MFYMDENERKYCMKKLKQIIWYICVVACTIFVDLSVHYIQDRKNETEYQVSEKQEKDQILREKLYITGDSFQYTPDTVTIDNMQIDENQLMIALIYFNYKNSFGISLTKDEALQEYHNFCNNSGSYDKILAFSLYSWKSDIYFKSDLYDELEYLERNGICSDYSVIIDSELFVEICNNIMKYSGVWRTANGVDYGEYGLEKKLLDIVLEERCNIDENGKYYIELNGGIARAYCEWGQYAPPYSEEKLYITKIVYDGGDSFKENYNDQTLAVLSGEPVFGCYIGEKYDADNMKNSRVPDEWVIIDGDTQNPCFRYKNIQVSIELEEKNVKKLTLSIVEE